MRESEIGRKGSLHLFSRNSVQGRNKGKLEEKGRGGRELEEIGEEKHTVKRSFK